MNQTDGTWRDRFATPRLWSAQISKGDRRRGIVAMQTRNELALHGWDAATGTIGTTSLLTDGFTDSYWLSADGNVVFRLDDEMGNELGCVQAVCLADGTSTTIRTDLGPFTLRGGDASMDGSTIVFAPCNAEGFMLAAAPTDMSTPARILYKSTSEAWRPHVSADGHIAVIDTTDHNPGVRRFTVSAFDVRSGTRLRTLSDGPGAALSAARPQVTGVCFSPVAGDGRVLVAAGSDSDGRIRPAIWDPLTDQVTHVTVADAGPDTDVVPLDWSPDASALLLVVHHLGEQRVVVHDLNTGRSVMPEMPSGSYWLPDVRQPWFDHDGGLLASVEDAATPARVVRSSKHSKVATALAAMTDRPGRPARSITVISPDGTAIQGWLIAPAGTGPFPTLIHLHGGPHWFVPDAYDPAAQAWVEHGFAHLDLNFRGSTGRGDTFARQIHGDIGRLELEDLAAAREYLIDAGIASPSATFVSGESYGGYLTLYALARQPTLWAGGFAALAIADWTLAYRDASDALQAAFRAWFGGSPDEVPDLYRDRSPLTHVGAISAPIVAVHGRNDTRTPPAQMAAFEQAMRAYGKDLSIHWFDAGHGLGGSEGDQHALEWFLDAADRICRSTTT